MSAFDEAHIYSDWTFVNGTHARDCTICDHAETAAHDWADATCVAPKTCKTIGCGATEGEALGHQYASDADCTLGMACRRAGCAHTEPAQAAHDWADATCVLPKTCKTTGCGATEGEALGHDFVRDTARDAAATCIATGVEAYSCSRCDATDDRTIAKDPSAHGESRFEHIPDDTRHREICVDCGEVLYGGWNCLDGNGDRCTCERDGTCVLCQHEYAIREHDLLTEDGGNPMSRFDFVYHFNECRICGMKVNKESHTFTDWTFAGGTHKRECTECVYSETIDAHDWADATCVLPKTCKTIGCGATEGEALGHDFVRDTARDVAATCIATGVEAYSCSRCNATDDRTIAKDPSVHGESRFEHNPNTIRHREICTDCGEELHGGWFCLDDNGYKFTCERDGTCVVCQHEYTIREHDLLIKDGWNPMSYFDPEYHFNVCRICEMSINEESHTFTDWTFAGGTHKRECTECVYAETVDAHDWADATCVAPKTCHITGCGATEGEALGHDFVRDTARDATATCIATGVEAYSCSRCNATDDHTIAKDPSVHGESRFEHNPDETRHREICTDCGEVLNGRLICLDDKGDQFTCERDGTCVLCQHEYAIREHDLLIDTYTMAPWLEYRNDHHYNLCRICGARVNEEAHTFTDWTFANGMHKRECTKCDHAETTAAHKWADATCVAPKTCQIAGCGATEGDKTGHSFLLDVTAPTCENGGYTTYSCVNCRYAHQGREKDALGHLYGEWRPAVTGAHSAACGREPCDHTMEMPCEWVTAALRHGTDAARDALLCPVCGATEDGAALSLAGDAAVATVSGDAPEGALVVRIGALPDGTMLLTVCFARDGQLVKPAGVVRVTLPDSALAGYALIPTGDGAYVEIDGAGVRDADGGNADANGASVSGAGTVSLTVDFTNCPDHGCVFELLPLT